MYNYISKINKTFIDAFRNNIRIAFQEVDIASDASYLKIILKEVNKLFRIMSGRLCAKRDIPKANESPNVKKFNKLLENIDIDVTKLYNAQTIINSDTQNLFNFNSLERDKITAKLIDVQKVIYNGLFRSTRAIGGELIFKESFIDNTLNSQTSNVEISDRQSLTLKILSKNINKDIDKELCACYLVPGLAANVWKVYPNTRQLGLGRHWKSKPGASDVHYNDANKTTYLDFMTDTEDPKSASYCDFEAVVAVEDPSLLYNLREQVSSKFNKSKSFIMMDWPNSLQYEYINVIPTKVFNRAKVFNRGKSGSAPPTLLDLLPQNLTFKLAVPFKTSVPLSNQFSIKFVADDNNQIPVIKFKESAVFTSGGRKVLFKKPSEAKQKDYLSTGLITMQFSEPVIPARVELMLGYESTLGKKIDSYYMSVYSLNVTRSLPLETESDGTTNLFFRRSAWILVDAESTPDNELARAKRVLKAKAVS